MSLSTGARLGPYQITGLLGAGGMGEIYRARDTRLNRDVALKVLPEAFAADADRMARLEREAHALAALNHPNIAAIYGIEEGLVSPPVEAGIQGPHALGASVNKPVRALVLELVEGDTLADRIAQGPIPLDEALPIARQICDALEAAHEHGITHRDLKPANIKITPDDTVKVLDFGLAKLAEGVGRVPRVSAAASREGVSRSLGPPGSREQDPAYGPSLSPTVANSALATGVGILLGTAAYMSPEQARGKAVDKRTDIWAFGCVLYEMLVGGPLFGGETTAEVLASILKDRPSLDRLPGATPPAIVQLLRRCLEKDLRQRLRDIGEARIMLDHAGAPTAEAPVVTDTRALRRRVLIYGLGALLLGAVAGGLVVWSRSAPSAEPVRRFSISLPPDESFPGEAAANRVFAISPDGKSVAYVARQGGTQQLYLRTFDDFEAKALPETDGANGPFFSPDSQWVAFFADGKLKKISTGGGAPIAIADTAGGLQMGSWGANDRIVFPSTAFALSTVSAAGGTPQLLIGADSKKGENSVCCASFLPGSDAVLFSTSTGAGTVQIAVVSQSRGERMDLVQGGSPVYLPTGHLLYVQGGSMMAAPFDVSKLTLAGAAVPVVDGIIQSLRQGVAQYSVSSDGLLAYIPGRRPGVSSTLVWVDRKGAEQPVAAAPHAYRNPRLSPDGRRVAVGIDELGGQVWIYDLPRDTLTRLTFDGEENGNPAWSPDGTRMIFSSAAPGSPGSLFMQPADGSAKAERLTMNEYRRVPSSWSPDGQFLAFQENNPVTNADIWVLRLGDRQATPFLQGPFSQSAARFSPDERRLAYVSTESGRSEVYIQSYPGPGGKWQVSADGGTEPVWNPNGRELFYREGNRLMSVEVTTQPGFSLSKPKLLFEGPYARSVASLPAYDVSHDGERFLMVKDSEQDSPRQIDIVLNWFDELKRLVPLP